MRVVINQCYGGFGISEAALRDLETSPCPHIKRTDPRDYFSTWSPAGKTSDGWEARMQANQSASTGLRAVIANGKVINDGHDQNVDARSCLHLVQVVERMGPDANGDYARLVVIEIPDGVQAEIDEYDGIESIHELHRSWP